MTFEIVYKTVIVMTNINDVLRKLNVLSFKKSQNNIEKLMNMIKNDRIAAKSFTAKNAFVSSILSMIIVFVTSNKTIKFFTKIFKIMQLNSVKVVTANDVQRIINFNFYRSAAVVFFTTTMIINDAKNFSQMRVQTAQNVFVSTFNMIRSKNCYDCHQFDHRIENCSKILKLINDNLIHFNERKRMCFDKERQESVEMRLMYELFRIEVARVCLQQQTKI